MFLNFLSIPRIFCLLSVIKLFNDCLIEYLRGYLKDNKHQLHQPQINPGKVQEIIQPILWHKLQIINLFNCIYILDS